jgi:flagellar transcriptional activator FlhD
MQNAVVNQDIICHQGRTKMTANQIHSEIKDANLSYMLLAQQMIKDDKVSSIFRLGVSEEMADLIAGLTPAQILKMSSSNMMLYRFRFDERLLLNMISDFNKDRMMSQAHATILMTAQPVEALAA